MQRAWLFQANPNRFDLDAFTASAPSEAEWLVSRYDDQITPGDKVYLWRSAGGRREDGGVFAEAETITPVRTIQDDAPPELWADPSEALAAKPRVRITIKRLANKREVIRREWWKIDPILRDHLIMRMANHTTFAIDGPHLRRLDHMWSKTGSDWTYPEALAGLFAFVETHGGQVSKLPGSPVANVSLLVGRPIPGIYNKVMNFRSLDPDDERAGFDGASGQDKLVWGRFYDPTTGLRKDEVRREFSRLWQPEAADRDQTAAREAVDTQSERLASTLSLSELLARWAQRKPKKPGKPRVTLGQARLYDRDPLVSAIARKRANFRCEIPDCTVPLFIDREGLRFVEVHHIQMLAEGGDDTPENVACLCPLHHREAHHGRGAEEIANALRAVRARPTNEAA